MNGFGFIEYKDAMDARDVVPGESAAQPPHALVRHFADLYHQPSVRYDAPAACMSDRRFSDTVPPQMAPTSWASAS